MQASSRPSGSVCDIFHAACASPPPRPLLPGEVLCFPAHPSSFLRSPSLPFLRLPLLSNFRRDPVAAEAATAPGFLTAGDDEDESEAAKLAQVAERLESTSRYLKRLGGLGFWGQLVCAIAGSVILSLSLLINERFRSPAPAAFFATAGGVAAAFLSVLRSFRYLNLSKKLRKAANEPAKAPPRARVVKHLENGIVLNLVGMAAAVIGMLTTVGLLFSKALLTTSAVPYYQGIPPGQIPVLASDVFLVQASATTILSHFLGFVCSLELLRSVTLPHVQILPILKRAS